MRESELGLINANSSDLHIKPGIKPAPQTRSEAAAPCLCDWVQLEKTDMSTPSAHEPPSLPTSPSPKRTRIMTMLSAEADLAGDGKIAPPPPLSIAPPLLVKKLSPAARPPTRGSAYAAGYDLYAAKPCTIAARGKALVSTDIAVAIGQGCCTFDMHSIAFHSASILQDC